jgi:hypothetical protein
MINEIHCAKKIKISFAKILILKKYFRLEMERYQQLLYEQQMRIYQLKSNGYYSNHDLSRNSPLRCSVGPSPSLNRTHPPPSQLPIMRRSYSLNPEQIKAARKVNGGVTSPKRVSFSTLPNGTGSAPPLKSPVSPTRTFSPQKSAPSNASNKVAPMVSANGFARQKRPMSIDSVFFNKPLPPVPEARTWLLGGGRKMAPKAPESESGSEAGEIQRILFKGGSTGGAPSYVSFRGEYTDGVAVVLFGGCEA